jgi:hypothetical protein
MADIGGRCYTVATQGIPATRVERVAVEHPLLLDTYKLDLTKPAGSPPEQAYL